MTATMAMKRLAPIYAFELVCKTEGALDLATTMRWLLDTADGRECLAEEVREKRLAKDALARDLEGDDAVDDEKEKQMESTEKIVAKFKRERIAKLAAMPISEVAKMAIFKPDENVLMIDEAEFTDLVTKAAVKAYPNLAAAQAFSKMFSEQSEQGTLIRKAWGIVKAMPIQVSLMPVQTHTPEAFQDAVSNTEKSEAYRQLVDKCGRPPARPSSSLGPSPVLRIVLWPNVFIKRPSRRRTASTAGRLSGKSSRPARRWRVWESNVGHSGHGV